MRIYEGWLMYSQPSRKLRKMAGRPGAGVARRLAAAGYSRTIGEFGARITLRRGLLYVTWCLRGARTNGIMSSGKTSTPNPPGRVTSQTKVS